MTRMPIATSIRKLLSELFLLVVGVSIALWLENLVELRKEREIEQEYLHSFARDFDADREQLTRVIRANKKLAEQATELSDKLLGHSISDKELLQSIHILMNYNFFTAQDFTLQALRETGDFRLIEDKSFTLKLLQLKRRYDLINESQINFQNALDDYIIPLITTNINIATQQIVGENFTENHQLANLVFYTISDLEQRIKLYENTLIFLSTLDITNHQRGQ